MNAKENILYLVDGSSYLHRAYHALPELMNSKGLPTGAIYGVINMLRRLLKENNPQYLAVVFDSKGKTLRHQVYADYKANRPPMQDELVCQLEPLYQLIRAMGIPLIFQTGIEADDIIASLAKQAEKKNWLVVISTGDKDLAQLVNQQISLINTMNNTQLDVQEVKNKFGVAPELITDYLALIGDKVDNIPGINNVGPKTAVKWLNEYGNLENLIRHAENIGGKVGENLRHGIEQLSLSKQLVTLHSDLDLAIQSEDLKIQPKDQAKMRELLAELEFKSWLKEELAADEPLPAKQLNAEYYCVTTEKELDNLLAEIERAKIFAFDVETTSLDTQVAKLVGISLACQKNQAYYIPVGHLEADNLDLNLVIAKLKEIFSNPSLGKIAHNLKYDFKILSKYGIEFGGNLYDTMLESYVLNSVASRHDLDSLSLKYLDHQNISFEDLVNKKNGLSSFAEVKLPEATAYAAEDADMALQLHEKFWPEILQHPSLEKLFRDIEMPLVLVLAKMENYGVLLDVAALKKQSQEILLRLENLTAKIFLLAGEEFNIDSPKQLQKILYEKLQLPVLQRTPSKQPSTAEPVLQELALNYELPQLLLEYRMLAKLKSTYVDRLPEQISPLTNRVHTSLQQAITATGRLSSANPNLQNIPIRNKEGQQIRAAFIAPPGYKIVSADYSQIELRIMAHLSQDPGLLNAFQKDLDIHRATAAEILGLSLDQVSDEDRRKAKAVNFGLIYGMSAFGLSVQLGISRKDAEDYIARYFNRYPQVKKYMHDIREQAARNGYVETICGRRLYLPDIQSRNFQLRAAAERAAINAPMQGSAADIIKLAMLNIDRWIVKNNIPARLILQVHDELLLEVKAELALELSKKISELMEQAVKLSVPLKVSTGIGDNWQEAH